MHIGHAHTNSSYTYVLFKYVCVCMHFMRIRSKYSNVIKWLMFVLTSFAGKISSEEPSAHVHPEVEGLSGPGSDQEGEERPVSSHPLVLVPPRGWSWGPSSFLPLCGGSVRGAEKSLGDVTKRRDKQREIGKALRFVQLGKRSRCCKERDDLTHETNCFNNFSFNK